MFRDESHRIPNFLLEPFAQSDELFFEIADVPFELRVCWLEESRVLHFLRDLRRAKTSSAGMALIFPALYSSYLRSASSAQSLLFSSSEMSSRLSRSCLASCARAATGSSRASDEISLIFLPMVNVFYRTTPSLPNGSFAQPRAASTRQTT